MKLSVVNPVGKEAVVTVLGPGDFFWSREALDACSVKIPANEKLK